jgi:hypothetical protein
MHADIESLRLRWRSIKSKIQPYECRHMPATKTAKDQHGRLRLQPAQAKTKGSPFHFSNLIFADDVAFFFESFVNLVAGTTDLQQTFARFGLLMQAAGTTNADAFPDSVKN